jgi:hypothetical protein
MVSLWSLCTNNAYYRCLWTWVISITYAPAQKWQMCPCSKIARARHLHPYLMLRVWLWQRHKDCHAKGCVSMPIAFAWPRQDCSELVHYFCHRHGHHCPVLIIITNSHCLSRAIMCISLWQTPCKWSGTNDLLKVRAEMQKQTHPCHSSAGDKVGNGVGP